MPTIRERFHTIANWHNKITLAAGCTKELLKEKLTTNLSLEQLKAELENAISILEQIENDAYGADQKVMELKTYIYKNVDPETNLHP